MAQYTPDFTLDVAGRNMSLSARDRELVALGAAMASNCVPCIEYHIPKAREAGLSDSEILEAIRLSDRVRQVPAHKVLEVALRMVNVSDSGIAKNTT